MEPTSIGSDLARTRKTVAIALLMLIALLVWLVQARAAQASPGDVIITNGVVTLGIHPEGHLNVPGGPPSSGSGTTFVGVRYNLTGAEATAPGCLCEGWGAADATSGVTGYANEAIDFGANNITPISFVTTPTTAISVVEIQDASGNAVLRVTQDYHPSLVTTDLYEVLLTIENVSGSPVEARYRRVMDWDVEPTEFNEFVTANIGTSTNLIYNSNDGFQTANPLTLNPDGVSPLVTGNFTDVGPTDHGALFDFGFGTLAPGDDVSFRIFYGASGTEAGANAALAAVGAEVYSLGQCNGDSNLGDSDPACSETTGTPNTFIFAFAGVGGQPIFSDVAVEKTADQASINAGDTAAFTITTRNLSAETATGVTLTDVRPPGVLWSEDSAECEIVAGTLTCTYRDLLSGASRVVHVTGPTDAADCGTLTNTATVAATNDSNPANNASTATITVNCPPPPTPTLDHFKCYRAIAPAEHAAAGERVSLEDQFDRSRATIAKLYNLCNPVDKNGEGISQPDAHLVEYKLVDRVASDGRFRKHKVEAENQFGTVSVVFRRPNRLLVPSSKALAGTEPGAVPERLDHYLCYKVQWSSPSERRSVLLADQFGREWASIRKPRLFCTPVSKDGGDIQRPRKHLVCYVARTRTPPVRRNVVVRNQFGLTALGADKTRHLCVPSTKRVIY